MVASILFVLFALVVVASVGRFVGIFPLIQRTVVEKEVEVKTEEAVVEVPAVEVAQVSEQVIGAIPLHVRQINEGKATLLVRYRSRKRACTGMLIIWSGAKRRRIQDSYYDLGIVDAQVVTEDVIEHFMAAANTKLFELTQAGRKKRQVKVEEQALQVVNAELASIQEAGEVLSVEALAAVQTEAEQLAPFDDLPIEAYATVQSQDEQPACVAEAEDNLGQIKLRKFPSVYRGVITEIGMLPQVKGNEQFEVFGVRLMTDEGVSDAVFGANLKLALRDAQAEVGDRVEIVKIGRKIIDPKKAPMNLFTAMKLSS